MPEASEQHKFELLTYDPKLHLKAAVSLIQFWIGKQGGDVEQVFRSLTKLDRYCRVVMYNGEMFALLYPDFDTISYPAYVKVHAVLSTKAWYCKSNQFTQFHEYLYFLFKFGFDKVAVEFPACSRLTRRIVEGSHFTLEGTHRQEWPKKGGEGCYDVYYYGLLKTEWEERYGR